MKKEALMILSMVKKGKKEYEKYYIAEGKRVCKEFFISSLFNPLYILCTKTSLEESEKIKKIHNSECNLIILPDNKMNYLSNLSTPPGIILIATKKKINEGTLSPTFVFIEGNNPLNLGSIIRTSCALSRKEVVCIGGCHANNYKVIQASAGTIAHVNVRRLSWKEFLENKSPECPLYLLDSNGRPIDSIIQSNLHNAYIVIGNEAHGISKKKSDYSFDEIISIPMNKKCESLNVAIASAIVGYQAWG